MTFDFATLEALRRHHPAWRLLRSDHAPLVASFLHRVFVAPNVRVMQPGGPGRGAGRRAVRAARAARRTTPYPKPALDYLNDWAAHRQGLAAQVLPAGLRRAAVRPDAGHREGDRLAGDACRAQLRRHRVAPADPVRAAAADERGQRDRSRRARAPSCSSGATRSTPRSRGCMRGDVPLLDDTALKDRFQQFTAAGARAAGRLPRGRAQLPQARPPRARAHRAVGRRQGRAAARRSWASATRSPTPTRAAASAPSGTS